jgi:hypothetical protein
LGVALEERLHNISYWGLSEGWTLGFFDGAVPRPAAYILQQFATRFGTEVLTVTGATPQVSVYAGRDATKGKTTIFVVNKSTTPHELALTLAGLSRTEPASVRAPALSLTVAELADAGGAAAVTVYREGMAAPGPQ